MGIGSSKSTLYKSAEDQLKKTIETGVVDTRKIKRDGTVLRTKEQIIKSYDESNLPEPFRSLYELDYCWRLNYTMYRHSFILGMPLTMVYHIWVNQPRVWNYKLRTIPFKRIGLEYISIILIVNALNVSWSFLF